MMLVFMDGGDPYLHYGSKQNHFMDVNIKITGGGGDIHPPSLDTMLQKWFR